MRTFNILHLSDLHMNRENLKDIKIILNALTDDIKTFDQKEITIDFICFTGDLINRGDNAEDEMELALDNFITPLLELTNISPDKFLLIPGNHDIDRSKIDPYTEKGLRSELIDRKSINHFFDNIENNTSYFDRTRNIKEFINLFVDKADWSGPLNYTKKFTIDGTVIGFACFDSAWRSSGDDDYRNLIIGEREVDKALKELEGADIKLALVHHPFDWLVNDDERAVLPVFSNFHLVLNGHFHSLGERKIVTRGHSLIQSSCGALFSGNRSYYNGYNIIEVDPKIGQVKIHLREFFDSPRRCFDAALSISENGIITHDFDIKDKTIGQALEILHNIKPSFYEETSNLLVSNMVDMEAPRDLNNIFISPDLNKESNYKRSSNEEREEEGSISLMEILTSDNNILFIGQGEVGKTTLLHYVANYYLDNPTVNFEVPFYIDFNNFPPGKTPLEREMLRFSIDFFEGENTPDMGSIKNLLEKGKCVLLIDNLNLSRQRHIERLNSFIKEYPNNRFIFTAQEDIFRTIASDFPTFECEVKKVYIRTLSKSGVRELITKWFFDKEIDIDLMLNRIMYYLNNVGMPRTPLVVSLILATCRQYEDYIPINEANVMENFMQIILQKMSIEDSKSSSFDFHSKERFLCYLSWEMTKSNKNWIPLTEFHSFTSIYHEKQGLSLQKSRFDELFFEKGILLKRDNQVYFRYTSIQEYYLAKAALNNASVFEFIMKDDSYHMHINEINFYTGMKRDEVSIINFLKGQLTEKLSPLMNKIRLLENYGLDGNILPKSIEVKGKKSLEEKEIDQLTNLPDNAKETQPKEKSATEGTNLFEILTLYGRTIRNSENISIVDKKKHLQFCFLGYMILLAIFKEALENASIEIESDKTDEDKSKIRELENVFKITIPFVLQNIAFESIGTGKLEETLTQLIKEEDNEFIRFMMVFLYSDLKLKRFLIKIKQLINSTKNRDVLLLIKAKLQIYYMLSHSSNTDKLLNLMSDVELKVNNISSMLKSEVRKGLSRQLKRHDFSAK